MEPAARQVVESRTAGVLLHISSLPGDGPIGDLGPAAYDFVDRLADAGQTWWQVLPLGPTGYGDSPYQCFSAFAGNPLLISLELLHRDGLLDADCCAEREQPSSRVDFSRASNVKSAGTTRAWQRLRQGPVQWCDAFERFCQEEAAWLDDFALFLALKEKYQGWEWQTWDDGLRMRHAEDLRRARADLANAIGLHKFRQFLFYQQWRALRDYARQRGVRFIGDMPIFVANDSADVWARPELFQLDAARRPTFVAGVPPDYFASDGQRWGNPLYDWDGHRAADFAWWIARLKAAFASFELVRLDHFRGFEAYWQIPASCPTAREGQWRPAPGEALLKAALHTLGRLPLIAEDLGVITPQVDQLRAAFNLPGMRILQFAFGGAQENRFLPHHYDHSTVVYTGTHDNDTTQAWYDALTDRERANYHRYAPDAAADPVGALVRLAWASVADLAIVPMQDVLRLGNEARMNLPGRPTGNWGWRLTPAQLDGDPLALLAHLTETYQRRPAQPLNAATGEPDHAA